MSKPDAVVTGGSGFLGRFLVQHLLKTNRYASVTIFDLNPPSPPIPGAYFYQGDLTDAESVAKAFKDKHVVFHTATAAPTAQNAASAEDLMFAVNLTGTRNVLDACRTAGVQRLVYTSSASVVFDGRPLVGVDEKAPYAEPAMDYYTQTKAEAEEYVLGNRVKGLRVCALRPSAIFGPGDRLTVPSIAERAKSGKMKYIIGKGDNLFDFTYVENVAHAHALADKALANPDTAGVADKQAFFINNDEPVKFWGMMGDICEGLGYERPSVKLPVWLMMIVALAAVFFSRIFRFKTDLNPMRVCLCSVERTLSIAKAKEVLGYKPIVSMKVGLQRTLAAFPELRRDAAAKEGGTKAE